jgi:hypothetical protein
MLGAKVDFFIIVSTLSIGVISAFWVYKIGRFIRVSKFADRSAFDQNSAQKPSIALDPKQGLHHEIIALTTVLVIFVTVTLLTEDVDLFIIAAALGIGVFSTFLAYDFGGRAWISKFSIKGDLDVKKRRVRPILTPPKSGLYGEISALSMVLIILLVVNLVTEDVGISMLITNYKWPAIGLFGTVCSIVVAYELYTCRKTENCISKSGKKRTIFSKRLTRGYIPYTIYSIINFSAVIMIVGLVAAQTFEQFQDYQVVERQLKIFFVSLNVVDLSPDVKMVLTEQIYSKVREGASFMVDQINTLVLLVFCSFGTQYVVKHTPIRQAYEESALGSFDVLLWLSIGFIVLYAWSVHFFVYDGFFGSALSALDASRDQIASGGWVMLQRFNDLYIDLTERRGLTGFMISLTNDRGGLLLALGAAGWIIDKRRDRDATRRKDLENSKRKPGEMDEWLDAKIQSAINKMSTRTGSQ